MKAAAIGRKAIRIADSAVNNMVLTIILSTVAFAGYALWDSQQIYSAADKSNYEVYKPSAAEGEKSFQELRALNSEVFAWLTVYGTNIDYPVAQGPDNMKYVSTNAEGKYSLSGAIFLDCANHRDFNDFNSIIYGHHMAMNAMFGEIGHFADKSMFDSHQYGNLYFDGTDHGIEFFAFIHADAYDIGIYTPDVKAGERQAYLDYLLENALYTRDIGVTTGDRIVLLSTCSSSSTNGRDILAGRIKDEVYGDQSIANETDTKKLLVWADIPLTDIDESRVWLASLFISILLSTACLRVYLISRRHRRDNHKKKG